MPQNLLSPHPMRKDTDVHLAEHVRFQLKPLRIPEQGTEHAPCGLYHPIPPLLALLTLFFQGSTEYSWKQASTSFSLRYAYRSFHDIVSVTEATAGKLLCKTNCLNPAILIPYIHKGWQGQPEHFLNFTAFL